MNCKYFQDEHCKHPKFETMGIKNPTCVHFTKIECSLKETILEKCVLCGRQRIHWEMVSFPRTDQECIEKPSIPTCMTCVRMTMEEKIKK